MENEEKKKENKKVVYNENQFPHPSLGRKHNKHAKTLEDMRENNEEEEDQEPE